MSGSTEPLCAECGLPNDPASPPHKVPAILSKRWGGCHACYAPDPAHGIVPHEPKCHQFRAADAAALSIRPIYAGRGLGGQKVAAYEVPEIDAGQSCRLVVGGSVEVLTREEAAVLARRLAAWAAERETS